MIRFQGGNTVKMYLALSGKGQNGLPIKGSVLKGKNAPCGSKLFPFRVDPFSEED